jgi:TonB family protein
MSSKIIKLRRQSNIFINYRREDSSGHAGRLFDALSGHFAGRLFMDVDTLEPGVDFVEAIEQAVGSCEVLIVVIGREWLTVMDAAGQRRLDDPADFVRLELETALERKIRVIPVLVQDAPMPRVEELPPSLARLARRNAIELSDARWAYDVERLGRTIQSILKEKDAATLALTAALEKAAAPPAPVVPAAAAKAAGSPARLRLLFLAAFVLVAAAGLASAFWLPSGNKSTDGDSNQAAAPLEPVPLIDPTVLTPSKPVPEQTTIPQQAAIQQPVPRPPSPLTPPPAPSASAVYQPPVPSPADSGVVIPVQLAGEVWGHQKDGETMNRGDLIMDGPGVEEPQLSAAPLPTYPPSLADRGRYAKVVTKVLVDENGAVADARVESASVDDGSADAEFRNAALAAAHQARFEPATKNGVAGKMWWGGALTYEFGTEK